MGVERGQVVQLGPHRLMCGDSGDPDDVARLMDGATADLVMTSPPYAKQRTYVSGVGDWQTLMERTFGHVPAHPMTQVMVNLGLVHRQGEWWPYWEGWIEWMRSSQGWRRAGWYVWDQGFALPREAAGRLGTSHEFVFHLRRAVREPHRTQPCKSVGRLASATGLRSPKGNQRRYTHAGKAVPATRVADGVIRVMREMRRGHVGNHPAVFPVELPAGFIRAYTDPGERVYDPFIGSGTTLLACEREGRVGYGMDIEPSYCDIAIARYEAERRRTTT